MEANSILQDLMFNSILFQHIKYMDIAKVKKIVNYIKNILIEYDSLKQLHMLTTYNANNLIAYSLAFIHNETKSLYLHKIHVNEPYRNHNIGTGILKSLQNENYQITLLCSKKNKLSRNIYNGLLVMSNTKENNNNQVFLLKDSDVNHIIDIIKS